MSAASDNPVAEKGAGLVKPAKNLGWRVTLAGLGINLALGVLYSWSVLKKEVPDDWGWNDKAKFWPYAIACLVFSLVMVPAGRLQDKIGPRLVATVGGILVGIGMIVAWLSGSSHVGYLIGFGLLVGAGIGFGYASATPPAVKWFPAARTGMIAGLVVAGFGLAPAYTSPLTTWLIGLYGIPITMLVLGIAFLFVVVGLAQLLAPPPRGFVPAGATAAYAKKAHADVAPKKMLATVQFYLLWFMYFCGAGAGLMIIGTLASIGLEHAGITQVFLLVVACALGNGAGRIVAGTLSDKLGRRHDDARLLPVSSALDRAFPHAARQLPSRHAGHDAPVRVDRGQLRGKPLSLPVSHQGLLRAEELRRQLRAGVYGVGDRRFRDEPVGGEHSRLLHRPRNPVRLYLRLLRRRCPVGRRRRCELPAQGPALPSRNRIARSEHRSLPDAHKIVRHTAVAL